MFLASPKQASDAPRTSYNKAATRFKALLLVTLNGTPLAAVEAFRKVIRVSSPMYESIVAY